MFMTQEADNAVRIVYNLACHGVRRDAKSIAEETSVSLCFSLKILRKLVESGIVKSFMGKYGGYELAKPPEDITLGEVIRTVDGPYMISRCLKEDYVCSVENGCTFREVYADISDTISDRLDNLTFEGFLQKQ
jgi:Rrf2 family protein